MVQSLRGLIRVPSDKSLSHRVALFSALAEGTSRVENLLDSFDVRSTLGAISALGARIELSSDSLGLCGTITGWGRSGPQAPGYALQCGNSGTTARLLLGALSGYDIIAYLKGDESLSKRPMNRVTLPLTKMGARFSSSDVSSRTCTSEPFDTLPMSVRGCSLLKAIDQINPIASAQVKSAILLAGLHADGTTSVTEPSKSRDHTELLLAAYGVQVDVAGLKSSIKGGQELAPFDCGIPGDPSSAAFMLVAAALIPGSEITVRDVLLNPTRTGFLEVMRRMGAEIDIETSKNGALGAEQTGNVTICYHAGLRATTIRAAEVASLIDEVPILALLATAAVGETVFERVEELRVKESDRLAAVVRGLTALGFDAREHGDDLRVSGGPPRVVQQRLESYNDHRLAMTWSIAERAFDLDLDITGLESIPVSYPNFFADLKHLS